MRVLITTGGTAGHINPALALAAELSGAPEDELLFVGGKRGQEGKALEAAGVRCVLLPVEGLPTRPDLRFLKAAAFMSAALPRAMAVVRSFKPDVCVGMGGYASVPTCLAAALLRVPLVLHEQNSVPGRANRLLARYAAAVALTFPESVRYLPAGTRNVLTGDPIRAGIVRIDREVAREKLGIPAGPPLLLVFGGSLGAKRLNEAVRGVLESGGPSGYRMLHLTGREWYPSFSEHAGPSYFPMAYLEEMEVALSAADLAVSRAGAGTLAELAAVGLPAVLVPYPHAIDDHQRQNARSFVESGAAALLEDEAVSAESLAGTVTGIIYNEKILADMAGKMQALGAPHAASRLAALVRAVGAGGPTEISS